jgi:hypothetical protein
LNWAEGVVQTEIFVGLSPLASTADGVMPTVVSGMLKDSGEADRRPEDCVFFKSEVWSSTELAFVKVAIPDSIEALLAFLISSFEWSICRSSNPF